MKYKHFIDDVIINYTRKPLPDNFYDFNILCKFITEKDYPFLEPFFSQKRIHIIYWIKARTYWILMKNATRNIIQNIIEKLINRESNDYENINKIIKTLPCTLENTIDKFTTLNKYNFNENRILTTSKIINAIEIQKFNVTTGYKYSPLGSGIEDNRVFVGTIKGQDVVSLCSMTFPSYNTCVTIGIGTEEKHRCKGYATSNVILMAKYIVEKGGSIHYSCETQNIASKNVAISAGLKNVARVYEIIIT